MDTRTEVYNIPRQRLNVSGESKEQMLPYSSSPLNATLQRCCIGDPLAAATYADPGAQPLTRLPTKLEKRGASIVCTEFVDFHGLRAQVEAEMRYLRFFASTFADLPPGHALRIAQQWVASPITGRSETLTQQHTFNALSLISSLSPGGFVLNNRWNRPSDVGTGRVCAQELADVLAQLATTVDLAKIIESL